MQNVLLAAIREMAAFVLHTRRNAAAGMKESRFKEGRRLSLPTASSSYQILNGQLCTTL